MTRPSALVLDGNEVKLRLQAERACTKTPVHIDWVRFTVIRRNAPFVPADLLLPRATSAVRLCDEDFAARKLEQVLRAIPDADFDAAAQALDLAQTVADAMGPDFAVAAEQRKGHDFYRFRWSIERNGAECGWVGYLASGDSPRQQAQSRTIHCNLYGAACTFAAPGWNDRLANICDERNADLTRCDLALDFFDGIEGGILRIEQDYDGGLMDVGGRHLVCNHQGDWSKSSKGARSFYVGSKEAGKQTNAYEKGDQLFGVGVSRWLRIELRYGNKLRVLSADMLRRPADFFAGASDWHALMLAEADALLVCPEPVKTTPRLALETVEAEAVRSLRWFNEVAAPTCAALWDHVGDAFLEFVTNKKAPGRMRNFSFSERARGYAAALARSSTAGGAGPAFA